MSALTSFEICVERLRPKIAQFEARYDGIFPPSARAVLEDLGRRRAAPHRAR